MPRFQVVLCDTETKEIRSYITRIDSPVDAVCNHPWITYVYNNKWVAENILVEDDLEATIHNIYTAIGWVGLCVNLDEEIMNALNAGDSSVSSLTQVQ